MVASIKVKLMVNEIREKETLLQQYHKKCERTEKMMVVIVDSDDKYGQDSYRADLYGTDAVRAVYGLVNVYTSTLLLNEMFLLSMKTME